MAAIKDAIFLAFKGQMKGLLILKMILCYLGEGDHFDNFEIFTNTHKLIFLKGRKTKQNTMQNT